MKYYNKKVVADGITFDSKKEYRRWCELKLMERAGEISDLQRQVKFVLIPSQYNYILKEDGFKKKGKCIERECAYIADFTYKNKNGEQVVEDVKGYKGGGAYSVFKIKRKMMLYFHKIRIVEV